jgi:hypothetical protein
MSTRTLTQAELLAELNERFGDDPMDWAFQCPGCKDVATARDFREALAAHPGQHTDGSPVMASDLLGQECIGRTLGALRRDVKYAGRGCNWCAYGLFSGPWFIVLPDGRKVASFPLADAPAVVTP